LKNFSSTKAALCFLPIAFLLLIVLSFPVEANVGVKSGDWAEYSVSSSWQSTISTLTPSYAIGMKWVKYEVTDVADNDITANVTAHYKNGTENSTVQTGNVLTQSGDLSLMFIQTDLGKGDSVGVWTSYMGSPESFTLNDTFSRNYLGTTREVNHLDASFSYSFLQMHFIGYWDRATGVACEILVEMSASSLGGSMTSSIAYTLTETNAWGGTPFWMQLWFQVIVIATSAVVVVSFVFFRKYRKRTSVRTEIPETG
jgi:hypothetical protein